MSESNRKLVSDWFDQIWNKKRREAIGETLAPDCVLHEGADSMRGPEGFYPFYDRIRKVFPDLHFTVEDTLLEGETVCVRWSSTMTHTGDGLGIPPTGKACRVTGISIVRVEKGKFVEGWQSWDMLGLMEQIKGAPKAPTYVASAL